jgi:hypothetical protein|tara:strand:- start:1008 stop:1235 length:228 start_codon:yes stop_codon:yes gene_type:complete
MVAFYEVTNRIPIPSRRAHRWDFTDNLKVGDSLAVKNYREVAAIRHRMKKNNKNITCKAFKCDHGDGFIRIWRCE